jgi:hypothetical protein
MSRWSEDQFSPWRRRRRRSSILFYRPGLSLQICSSDVLLASSKCSSPPGFSPTNFGQPHQLNRFSYERDNPLTPNRVFGTVLKVRIKCFEGAIAVKLCRFIQALSWKRFRPPLHWTPVMYLVYVTSTALRCFVSEQTDVYSLRLSTAIKKHACLHLEYFHCR